jgi:pimeloyl-ACP methyl ester carboxylesterase
LSIWAWGLSLTAQALRERIQNAKIGVIGHSRGGKAALLCGALDPRIDAVIANNSGAGGAASMAMLGDGAESLQQLVQAYPHWFNQQAGQAKVQNRILDIECCSLWSRIAPRPLLVLQAEDDMWANPSGTRETLRALSQRWKSSAASDALALIERQGGHAMQDSDWHQAAKFMRHAKFRESQH